MKHTFVLRYELDTPLAIAVALYLDSEHYTYLHQGLTNQLEIIAKGEDYYRCHQIWNVFGFKLGQTYTCRYKAPATFINEDVKPHPVWLPNVYDLLKIRTTLRYYENLEKKTTLSELTVELDLPFFLYPFRNQIQAVIEKVKILKDLEDVAVFDRRGMLFGRESNEVYLKRHQFLLHKEDYARYFGENSVFFGGPEFIKNESWVNIKDIDQPYVRKFLKDDYKRYTNFENADFNRWKESRQRQTILSSPNVLIGDPINKKMGFPPSRE